VAAISVDEPVHSIEWAEKKQIPFDLLSDPEQRIIGAFGLVNPDQPDLSLHAIYIVDSDGKVFYRKIGRRRAYSDELIDALDYRAGKYRKPVAAPP
jgi:peroxiredoxin